MDWTEEKLQQYISSGIEESLMLEYKAAAALDAAKKIEITKDVSAMANSAGGVIIYGLAEDPANRHLAGEIDPVNRSKFTKEWLEQVINNIQPRIPRVVISPVPIAGSPVHVVYVVAIPASDTAHQASDHRYYKRFNFQSVPMDDYEVRDVMNRVRSPKLAIECVLTGLAPDTLANASGGRSDLLIFVRNSGAVLARYVSGYLALPSVVLAEHEVARATHERTDLWSLLNISWSVKSLCNAADALPLLPGTSALILNLRLSENLHTVLQNSPDAALSWLLYADNSRPQKGSLNLLEMPDQIQDVTLFDGYEVP